MSSGLAAGNFFSAAFEDRCAAVAGASGGIFGLLGLFIADMVLNFETLTRLVESLEWSPRFITDMFLDSEILTRLVESWMHC
jgi:membrane associated rhomboid family serine protease